MHPLFVLIAISFALIIFDIYIGKIAPRRNQACRCPYCNRKFDSTAGVPLVRVAAGPVYAQLCKRCEDWHTVISNSVWIILAVGFIGCYFLVI